MAKRKTGTREWAESSYNIGTGCAHDCRYCYARSKAQQDGTIQHVTEWTVEKLKTMMPSTSKKKGWVMFPTTHDITPFYLPAATHALLSLLHNGNNVLIVSKPHLECVEHLCKALEPFKQQILFRFTIGGTNDQGKFWEPGAPLMTERVRCLEYAFTSGYATSVSMEPMLGTVEETLVIFKQLTPYVTDKIWIGKMNQIDRRVVKVDNRTAQECDRIRALQADDLILWLVEQLKDHPKVAWKDSTKEVIEKYS